MWITNAGFADLFTIFAKVDGEKFTAFIVERGFPGFSVGAEEHKMGIRGSSTCPLILNDCKVPVENVLGEIGKGHQIAFNVLNVGRIKLGAGCVGSARNCIEGAIAYAKQRKAFGKVIADFGLIREKLANMAAGIFTGEAMSYRTVGMMDAAIAQLGPAGHDDMSQVRKVMDEYAVECSILKVWGSEFISYVVDEAVQIHGGYGFVEEYPAERNYRDVRVNRIFEGTNEINRLVITGFLLKRAMSGQLPLMAAIKKIMDEVLSGTTEESDEGPLGQERKLVATAKKIGLFAAGVATQKYMMAIQDQQEIMGAIANMVIDTYAMESAVLRAQKLAAKNGEARSALAVAMTRVYMSGAMERIESAARMVIAACSDGDMLRSQLAILRRLCKYEPFNTVALRQTIAQRVIDTGKYLVS
jgi:alkylation response protein AidB-like acyl-CoA dehydrogenase